MMVKHAGYCKDVHLKVSHVWWVNKQSNTHGYHLLMRLNGFHSLDGQLLKEPCLVCTQELLDVTDDRWQSPLWNAPIPEAKNKPL